MLRRLPEVTPAISQPESHPFSSLLSGTDGPEWVLLRDGLIRIVTTTIELGHS